MTLLGIQARQQPRPAVSGSLWPDVPEEDPRVGALHDGQVLVPAGTSLAQERHFIATS